MAINYTLKFNQAIPERAYSGGSYPKEEYRQIMDDIIADRKENACFECASNRDANALVTSLRNVVKTRGLPLSIVKRKENVYVVKADVVPAI